MQVQTKPAILFGSSGCCFVAEALGCQCKWFLGRSPLLCRSTTVNRMQVHAKLATPFNCQGHLGNFFAVKTCLSCEQASTYSFLKHLARKHLVQNGCRVLVYRGTMVNRSTIIHAGSLGVGLQQSISFICECHLIAESLGCQCKWYWGRSPFLCGSNTLNGSTIIGAGSH